MHAYPRAHSSAHASLTRNTHAAHKPCTCMRIVARARVLEYPHTYSTFVRVRLGLRVRLHICVSMPVSADLSACVTSCRASAHAQVPALCTLRMDRPCPTSHGSCAVATALPRAGIQTYTFNIHMHMRMHMHMHMHMHMYMHVPDRSRRTCWHTKRYVTFYTALV
jgi:hypothetical protein